MDFKKLMGNNINNSPIWTMLEDNFNKYYIEEQNNINKLIDIIDESLCHFKNGAIRDILMNNILNAIDLYHNKSINIPKKIHQIWLGGKIPDKYNRLINTWKIKNPDWEYKLWTDDDINNFNLENIKSFNSIKNLGAKTDIFRYEILYREGGLYIDTDFECLKSFNDLIYLDLFSGTGHVDIPEVFNGLIACKPGHQLMRKLIDDIKIIDTDNFDEIISLTGPKYFSSKLFEWIKNNSEDKIVVFPTTFFYPFPAKYRQMIRIDDEDSQKLVQIYNTEKSYCTHLWYTSWQK